MKTIKQRSQLLRICDEIMNEILDSHENTTIQQQLAYIAMSRMKNAIIDEIKNANSFLKLADK